MGIFWSLRTHIVHIKPKWGGKILKTKTNEGILSRIVFIRVANYRSRFAPVLESLKGVSQELLLRILNMNVSHMTQIYVLFWYA